VAVVFDTNVLISAALAAQSKPSLALRWGVRNDVLLASAATLSELVTRMERAKFDRYSSQPLRREFVTLINATVRIVSIRRSVRACRDPDDDKFLEVAVNGGADWIVTGDMDLLALHPFEGVEIITPAAYLARVGA
jgi:putative PIN family toxin of toxin-antitoxin system